MSYFFNLSLVIPAARKQSFIDWALGEGRRAADSTLLRGFRCLVVAAVPGDKDFDKSPDKTFSLQLQFDNLSDCRRWHDASFSLLMESYSRWYGPNPLFFATVLKEL